ncbi:haloacid dehalogenase-like hydrolase [Catenulispora yoronensis]|uniref:Haloacid dehalogenase-like hydrolase n=1 Tax=Catenulispora yoronensis TaxID=450799 RepID=A0ABP5FD24_9ACTN
MNSSLLVLWDIDRTLIMTGGVGREVFAQAFEQVTGLALKEMPEPGGLTEPVIFQRALELHGLVDQDGLFARFERLQADGYRERAEDLRSQGQVLPGVVEALEGYSVRADVVSSVLTGNPRESAIAKLQIFGLDSYLNLDCGAFGSDDSDRAALVRVAWQRAKAAFGHAFGPLNTVIVGDTPKDVAAGQANGVYVVGVATGKYTEAQLRDAGANAVLPDLTAFPRLRALIDRGQG